MRPEGYTTAEEVGNLIFEIRSEAHLTQAQLGEEIGVSQSQVSRWEQGSALPGRQALESIERFSPGNMNELRYLWLRGRWEKFHNKPRPKRPETTPDPRDIAALWEGEA